MNAHSDTLQAHLSRDCTTLCHCWRLVRRDGVALGFTDHDRELRFDGTDFLPQTGFSQSEARASLGLSADTAEVEGALSSDRLAEADIDAGRYDGAVVETFLVNWRAPAERSLIRKAVIGRIKRSDGRFLAELESMARSLDKPVGRYLRRVCDAELGDARCRADISGAGFQGSGAVVAEIAPATLLVSGLGGFEPGWFSHGRLQWTGGRLEGIAAAIVDHRRQTDGTLLVLAAEAGGAEPGDGFTVTAGCDKSFAACKAKFANGVNFRGFPHMPGNDAAYGYAVDGMVFDGRRLVD